MIDRLTKIALVLSDGNPWVAWGLGFVALCAVLVLLLWAVIAVRESVRRRQCEREAGVRRLVEGLSADSHLTICQHGVAGHRPCPKCWEWLSNLERKDCDP